MPPLDRKAQTERLETLAQMDFIKTVFSQGLPMYLFGSYADDALLHQKPSRPHEDIDFIARRSDVELLKGSFEASGLRVKEETVQHGDKTFDRLIVKGKHLYADVFLIDFDDNGKPFMEISDPTTGERLAARLDDNIFNEQPTRLDEISVTTISPLAQIRAKGGQFEVGIRRPSRDKDVKSKSALVERFYPGEDPEAAKFKVQVQKL